jgi:hypothetical protein
MTEEVIPPALLEMGIVEESQDERNLGTQREM